MSSLRSAQFFSLFLAALVLGCGKAERKEKKEKAPSPNRYSLDEVISFGRGGRSERFKRGGWGDTEKDRTWSNARFARLTFEIADADQPLRLRMRLSGFTNPPLLAAQPVEVVINDQRIAEWEVVEEVADYVALIPAEVANHVQLNIGLRIPEAASPKVLGVADDPRLLGIACYELALTKPDGEEAHKAVAEYEHHEMQPARGSSYAFGSVIHLGLGAGGQRYKVFGWHPPEPGFAWMGNGPAVLELSVPPSERPLKLRMKLAGLIHPELQPFQPTEIYVNGTRVAEWMVGEMAEFEAAIPAWLAAKGDVRIELRTPKATSPKQLEIAPDPRLLGVKCEAFVLTEEEAGRALASPSPGARVKPTSR